MRFFESVHAARKKYKDDPEALEISVDTKAKVSLGEYVLGGKKREQTARVMYSKAGITIRQPKRSWFLLGS